jgi:hypothetical protein
MRLSVFVLTIIASLITCRIAFAGRVVLTDPNADGKITAEMYSHTDSRLSQKVSYEAKLTCVKQIISDLREMTGISLMAGKSESDWPVRSRKMNIFVKDVPLYELMDSIAHVMKFRWSLSDDDKMIYRLKVNSRSAAEADEMVRQAEKMQEQMWQKRRKEWADAIEKYGDRSASELTWLRDSDPQIYEQALLGSLQAVHALFEEVPEAKERFLAGKNFRICADDLTPVTKTLFYNAGNEFWKHMQRIGYVGGKKTQNPPGYGPKAVHENDRFDVVYKRLDAGTFTPNLRWGGASVSDTGYWHLYKNVMTDVNMDFEINGFRYLGSPWNRHIALSNIRINEGEDVDEVRESEKNESMDYYKARWEDSKKLEESLYPSESLIEHEMFPQLQQTIKINLENQEPNQNTILRFAESVALLQKSVSEASGLGVVSDCWINIPSSDNSLRKPDIEDTLENVLTKFCSTLNYNWDKPGSILEFRYRKWVKIRLSQIPDEWVAVWSKNTAANGYMGLEDIASMSNINYYQAEESVIQDPVVGIMGTYSRMLEKLDDNLPWLKLYSSLSQQQKRILFEGERGLFGSMLTSQQWALAKELFDRIGISRSECLMQASVDFDEDDPQYVRIWFKEVNTDSGQLDRLWKLILPRYNPPTATEK